MSLINRLIRDARAGAKELTIRPQDVGLVAEHCRALTFNTVEAAELAEKISAGKVKLMGVPIRVLGA